MTSTPEDTVRRAAASFNAGRIDEARRLCEQELKRSPGEPMLSHLLAAVLFSRHDVATARVHIAASLARRPDNAAAQLLAARIARAGKDFAAALGHVDRALALAPQRDTLVEKARILDQAGHRAPARETWQAILKAVPDSGEAAARLGRLAFEDGDLAGAASYLERATSADAPASAWFDLGLVRQDQRDHIAAVAAYRKALALKPDHAEAALNLGIALQESGDPEAAMQSYSEAYRLRPEMLGSIAMALTSASHGRLWLDEAALRLALTR
ncbi:tetratricopeptide repeat protein [Bradyrhizobium sp. STM 3843]|uniref:tetratricopeptide repeat protein n=1 Tax=Bradyrhizobium sp. STM 3843 TaxID=551947 RepID=UPI0002FA608F|nr:tetratricopeptide repeat protein [Bradyrhizobium sp. STM 3843]